MGLEASCTVRFGRRSSEGKARLESQDLQFRGAFRLDIPFSSIRAVGVEKGLLRIEIPEGIATFALGPAAERWAEKIRKPKSVIEKLGVKPGQLACVIGVEDRGFSTRLGEAGARVAALRAGAEPDLVFFQVERPADLARLAALEAAIRRDGAIWVIWRKGQPALKEDHVRAAALPVGLTDVKVVAFSETHSALKLVVPLARRSVDDRRSGPLD